MIKVFPFVLCRIAGDSYDKFKLIDEDLLQVKFKSFLTLREWIVKEELNLNDELFHYLKHLEDSRSQNLIQNIRRDLFNSRTTKNSEFLKASKVLSSDLRERLQNLRNQQTEQDRLMEIIRKSYDAAYWKFRKHITEHSVNDILENGLLFSSRSLLERIKSYTTSALINKKILQTEKSILKYLTRIYCKTSPFSTFTNLSIAKVSDQIPEFLHIGSPDSSAESIVRINNFILRALNELFSRNSKFRMVLLVRTNPTIKITKRRFKYLMNVHNIEEFKYLERNRILEFIYESLNKKELSYKDLMVTISEMTDSNDEEIDEYLLKLIKHGFIELHHGISGIDPDWHQKMQRFWKIETSNPKEFENLVKLLKDYELQLERFQHLSVSDRKRILSTCYDRFVDFIKKIEESEGNDLDSDSKRDPAHFGLKSEHFIYEDTSKELGAKIGKGSIDEIVQSLDSLLKRLGIFDWKRRDQETMKIYFLHKYQENSKVSLLKFYEDYYRDYKLHQNMIIHANNDTKKKSDRSSTFREKRHLKFKNVLEQNKTRSDRLASIAKFRSRVDANYDQLIFDGEIKLTNLDLEHFTKDISNVHKSVGIHNSYGAFIQILQNGVRTPRAVVNGTFAGYGKMFSRFLHLFDDEVKEKLKEYNKRLVDKDECFAENVDSSYFNANIHPSLMSYEIRGPSSQNSVEKEYQIPITDLQISYCQDKNILKLTSKKLKKEIFVFDLCFEAEHARSQLFQLLNGFSKQSIIPIQTFVSIIRNVSRQRQKDFEFVTIPRIIYDESLVLSRKRWEIPCSIFPDPNTAKHKADFATELHCFLLKNGIPNEVFITLDSNRLAKKEDKSKLTKDDYKPQYTNFSWPQYIDLLIHSLRKKPEIIVIEEMLPGVEDLQKIGNNRFVSEFLVNWWDY